MEDFFILDVFVRSFKTEKYITACVITAWCHQKIMSDNYLHWIGLYLKSLNHFQIHVFFSYKKTNFFA